MQITSTSYRRAFLTSAILTIFLFAFFLITNWQQPTKELLAASPFFLVLYFLLFTIGQPVVMIYWRKHLDIPHEKVVWFPILLIILLYAYLIIHGHTPFKGSAGLFIFFLLFPTLGFLAFKKTSMPVVWSDIVFLLLIVIPATSMSFGVGTSLPFQGGGFSNVMRLVIMISAVYNFGYIRNLPDIGFFPFFSFKATLYCRISMAGFLIFDSNTWLFW
ncbi:MAG: hypothetical protein R2822_13790 [Spirosomataceae bacterium]